MLESALSLSKHTVPIKIILQRPNKLIVPLDTIKGDRDYHIEMDRIRKNGNQVIHCTEMKSEDPLYLLYTSGSTSTPKGIIRTNGGHAVALRWSMDYIFNVGESECMFTASDIGWAVGHR